MKIITPLALMLAACASAPPKPAQIVFEYERLDAIATRFNDANPGVRIDVADTIKGRPVTGALDLHNPQAFAEALGALRYSVSQTSTGYYIGPAARR